LEVKIIFLNRLNRFWHERIGELIKEFGYVDFVTEPERAHSEIETANAIVSGDISVELIQKARRLRMIFVPFAGVDALPLGYIREHGIAVSNAHGNAPYVAERCVAMALAFYGKIIDYHNDLKESRWHGFAAKRGVRDTWDSLQGRSCAVIGTGEIGKHVARFLRAFGCKVVGFKRRPVEERPEFFDEITLNLGEALENSELIFICLPLTRETKGLFSAEILGKLQGRFLINVGRGQVVDEEALYRSLKDGILRGAGIDVWYAYPQDSKGRGDPSRYPIHQLPNVVLSPHIAGFTPQSARMNIEQTIENIRCYLRTGKPRFVVDTELMY
jgi:phosphoglycerate dehydrogenase-like enzyme